MYLYFYDRLCDKTFEKNVYCQNEISVNNRYAKLNKTYDTPALSLIT